MDLTTDLPAKGIPGAVSNTAPTEAELSQTPVAGDPQGQIRNRSSSDIKLRGKQANSNDNGSINKDLKN